jgi:hypothetical protein
MWDKKISCTDDIHRGIYPLCFFSIKNAYHKDEEKLMILLLEIDENFTNYN